MDKTSNGTKGNYISYQITQKVSENYQNNVNPMVIRYFQILSYGNNFRALYFIFGMKYQFQRKSSNFIDREAVRFFFGRLYFI